MVCSQLDARGLNKNPLLRIIMVQLVDAALETNLLSECSCFSSIFCSLISPWFGRSKFAGPGLVFHVEFMCNDSSSCCDQVIFYTLPGSIMFSDFLFMCHTFVALRPSCPVGGAKIGSATKPNACQAQAEYAVLIGCEA